MSPNQSPAEMGVRSMLSSQLKKDYDAPAKSKRKSRILVVDDEMSLAEMLAITLRGEGHEVRVVYSAIDALNILDDFAPDVMCIDFMMPDMNGQELAQEIRQRHDLLYIPIIMLTAVNAQDIIKLTSLDSGVDAFLTKPVSREELRVNIRTMLRIKTAQDVMLEALDRVSSAQEELLNYERQQGQYEAMQASIATYSHELAWPLSTIDITAAKMEKLLNIAETGKYDITKITGAGRVYLKEIRDALNQAGIAMQRLSETSRYTTKELLEDSFMLDLEQAVENK